jgi:hypothetical protein
MSLAKPSVSSRKKKKKEYEEYRKHCLVLEGCIANVGIPFRDNDHKQRVMGEYTQTLGTFVQSVLGTIKHQMRTFAVGSKLGVHKFIKF